MESNRASTRWHIIHTYKAHPHWSLRQIGTAVCAHHKTVKHWLDVYKCTGDVKDQFRSGRKRLVTKSDLSKLKRIAIKKHSPVKFSCSRLSKVLQAESGVRPSDRSVQRHLRDAGWNFGYAKKVLMLKASHRHKRLLWARKHLSRRTAFASWMFTDSKVFLLHRPAGKAGVKMWYPQDCRP